MARGNLIQGQGSGKVGDVVFMVRQGQQVSRVYTTSGSRSGKEASEASRIQRVKFGGASNQWGLYRYVSTRMYRKGRSSKQSDYNYFVKKNLPFLPYFTKQENADGVHVLQPGVFSEGTLGRIDLIHVFNQTFTEGQYGIGLADSGVYMSEQTLWSDTLASLKANLQVAYNNARKVTYLISRAQNVTIEEGEETFISQVVRHHTIIIDLYSEVTPGEDAMTVAAYFASKVSDASVASIITAQSNAVAVNNNVFLLWPASAAETNVLGTLGVLVFASNDNVSDCYTTVLSEDGVNPLAGPYAPWASYRTAGSLRVAADSYGYQAGVMRDNIASSGNDISAQVQAHAARVASVDAKASADFLKSVGDITNVQAKVVRKSAEEK